MPESIFCICTISLHYRFFLQKINLNIIIWGLHNFGQSWHLYGFILLVSSYGNNRFFVFLFCNEMPACIARICTVSLQYRFFLQKTNLNILQYSLWTTQFWAILAFIWFLFGVKFFSSS